LAVKSFFDIFPEYIPIRLEKAIIKACVTPDSALTWFHAQPVRSSAAQPFYFVFFVIHYFDRRQAMGERGSKKDKEKMNKQKKQQLEKKKQQQNAKMPVKKTA
jgi:hypothetical protein